MSIWHKVILVGDSNTGKVGIIHSFMGNSFGKGSYLTSSYVKKTIYLEDNNSVDLIIWDTCGKLEYSSLNEIFYKNSKVVIFVFDFTNKKSFDDIKN